MPTGRLIAFRHADIESVQKKNGAFEVYKNGHEFEPRSRIGKSIKSKHRHVGCLSRGQWTEMLAVCTLILIWVSVSRLRAQKPPTCALFLKVPNLGGFWALSRDTCLFQLCNPNPRHSMPARIPAFSHPQTM
jgi:hypothetical protein